MKYILNLNALLAYLAPALVAFLVFGALNSWQPQPLTTTMGLHWILLATLSSISWLATPAIVLLPCGSAYSTVPLSLFAFIPAFLFVGALFGASRSSDEHLAALVADGITAGNLATILFVADIYTTAFVSWCSFVVRCMRPARGLNVQAKFGWIFAIKALSDHVWTSVRRLAASALCHCGEFFSGSAALLGRAPAVLPRFADHVMLASPCSALPPSASTSEPPFRAPRPSQPTVLPSSSSSSSPAPAPAPSSSLDAAADLPHARKSNPGAHPRAAGLLEPPSSARVAFASDTSCPPMSCASSSTLALAHDPAPGLDDTRTPALDGTHTPATPATRIPRNSSRAACIPTAFDRLTVRSGHGPRSSKTF